jgi:hypothetical protein
MLTIGSWKTKNGGQLKEPPQFLKIKKHPMLALAPNHSFKRTRLRRSA